jgi:hypothetical protein
MGRTWRRADDTDERAHGRRPSMEYSGRHGLRTHRATGSGHRAVRCSGERTEQHVEQDRVHTERSNSRFDTVARTPNSALHAHRQRHPQGTRRVPRPQRLPGRTECNAPNACKMTSYSTPYSPRRPIFRRHRAPRARKPASTRRVKPRRLSGAGPGTLHERVRTERYIRRNAPRAARFADRTAGQGQHAVPTETSNLQKTPSAARRGTCQYPPSEAAPEHGPRPEVAATHRAAGREAGTEQPRTRERSTKWRVPSAARCADYGRTSDSRRYLPRPRPATEAVRVDNDQHSSLNRIQKPPACRTRRSKVAPDWDTIRPAGAGMGEQSARLSTESERRPFARSWRSVRPNDFLHDVPTWHHRPEPARKDRTGQAAPAVGHRKGARAIGVREEKRKLAGECVYCGEEATSIDHLIPQFKNGPDAADNLVLSSPGRWSRTPEAAQPSAPGSRKHGRSSTR